MNIEQFMSKIYELKQKDPDSARTDINSIRISKKSLVEILLDPSFDSYIPISLYGLSSFTLEDHLKCRMLIDNTLKDNEFEVEITNTKIHRMVLD